jgi:hypothetical protein
MRKQPSVRNVSGKYQQFEYSAKNNIANSELPSQYSDCQQASEHDGDAVGNCVFSI